MELLNRSAIVLMCSIWEAYCEDLCGEILESIIKAVGKDHWRLPEELRVYTAQKLILRPSETGHVGGLEIE